LPELRSTGGHVHGNDDTRFASIGGPGVEGTLMTYPLDPRKRPEAAAVVKKFELMNFDLKSYTLYSYSAVEVLKQAVERAIASLTGSARLCDAGHPGAPACSFYR
jgi:branched-chain amino acid transport system substrate-binding protein